MVRKTMATAKLMRWKSRAGATDTLKGLTTYYPFTNTHGVGIKPENVWPDSWTHATAKLEWTPTKITLEPAQRRHR